jgi:hypothetical protein
MTRLSHRDSPPWFTVNWPRARLLRTMSGMYDQAARAASSL